MEHNKFLEHFTRKVKEYERTNDHNDHIILINRECVMYIWFTPHGEWKYSVDKITEWLGVFTDNEEPCDVAVSGFFQEIEYDLSGGDIAGALDCLNDLKGYLIKR